MQQGNGRGGRGPIAGICVVLLACTGCAPSPWTQAREACGIAGDADWTLLNDPSSPGFDPEVRHHLVVDDVCAGALLADLGTDEGELTGALGVKGGLGAHLEGIRAGDTAPDAAALLVWGSWWLLASDFGGTDVTADPWLGEAFVDRLAGSGTDVAGEALYDLVAESLEGIQVFPDVDGVATGQESGTFAFGRTVDLGPIDVGDPAEAAWVLVHEATHVGGPAHVACDGSAGSVAAGCDADLEGAFGFQIGAATLNARAVPSCDAPASSMLEARDAVWERFVIAEGPGGGGC